MFFKLTAGTDDLVIENQHFTPQEMEIEFVKDRQRVRETVTAVEVPDHIGRVMKGQGFPQVYPAIDAEDADKAVKAEGEVDADTDPGHVPTEDEKVAALKSMSWAELGVHLTAAGIDIKGLKSTDQRLEAAMKLLEQPAA